MRLHAWQSILLLTIVFACGYANAGAIAKRATGDASSSGSSQSALSQLVDSTASFMRRIPFVGNSIANFIDWVMKVVKLFEIATNGALARILGGTLPCYVSLTGTTCTGLENNGGFGKLLLEVIDDIPLLPSALQTLIKLGIQMIINPTMDVLFGGVQISASDA